MKFYAQLLGFSEIEGGIIQIYPTENQFDIGFVDLYSLKPQYDNISFQTQFNSIFKYYPTSNNNVWNLKTHLNYNTTDNVIIDGTLLDVDDELWIESERIKITSIVDEDDRIYDISRGINGSIPVSHFYNAKYKENSNISLNVLTNKRLSPIGIIVKFYSTNNIGGETKVLGYGRISNVTLSNSKLITVECEQLYKQLEKDFIYVNDSVRDFAYYTAILNHDSGYQWTCEFLELLNLPSWFNFSDIWIESKKISDEYVNFKLLNLKKSFEQLLLLNSSIITFDKTIGKYILYKIEIPTSYTPSPTSTYITNYININDFDFTVEVFEKISSINLKYKNVKFNNDNTFDTQDVELTLYDDIVKTVSNKNYEFDISDLLFFNKTNINDVLSKLVFDRIYFINLLYDVVTITSTKWKRTFEIGQRYDFSDNHILKSLVDSITNPTYTCIGYEDNKVKFISSEKWSRYFVSFYRDITWDSGISKWKLYVPQYIETWDNTIDTIATNDYFTLYHYQISTDSITESDIQITNVSWDSTEKCYLFTSTSLTYNSDYIKYISYKRGITPSSVKYQKFLYQDYGYV